MRLICPNCGAQYEVDDAVIPEQGRDVQCSNCGHTWFQQPAHLDAELADELGEQAPFDEEPHDEAPEAEPGGAPGTSELQSQELAPDVADVLREEAQREAEARRADAGGDLETQPDLGLDDAAEIAANRSAAARARMARLRGLDDNEAEGAPPPVGSRRELLPDVEEISDTLRSSRGREEADGTEPDDIEDVAPENKRSGRLLSRLIILAAILAVVVYMLAPQIVKYVPQAEPYLVTYVDWANGMRTQINGLIDKLVAQVQALIG